MATMATDPQADLLAAIDTMLAAASDLRTLIVGYDLTVADMIKPSTIDPHKARKFLKDTAAALRDRSDQLHAAHAKVVASLPPKKVKARDDEPPAAKNVSVNPAHLARGLAKQQGIPLDRAQAQVAKSMAKPRRARG